MESPVQAFTRFVMRCEVRVIMDRYGFVLPGKTK
jgi:hypothetical protein